MYYFSDPEVLASIAHAKRLCARMRQMCEFDPEYRGLLEELIPGIPASATVVAPFLCDHGSGITLGENVFINANCTFTDGGRITIGDNTRIGPNCSFYTPVHPIDHLERREPKEIELPITIGSDCWFGGNVTVRPGVTIGDRAIIACGSVVVHDVPSDVMVAGNPAVIKKHL